MDVSAVWALEIGAKIQKLIESAQRELWLISPYTKTQDARGPDLLSRSITSALKRSVRVHMVVRKDETGRKSGVMDDLMPMVEAGMRVYEMENLHAKLYMAEKGALVTSLNLYAPTRGTTLDLGIHVGPGPLLEQLREFLNTQVKPNMNPVGRERVNRSGGPKRAPRLKQAVPRGTCIRCGDSVMLDLARPYCDGCFKSWVRYENPDYEEDFCHECGSDVGGTSMRKPRCRDCWDDHPRRR